MDDDFNVDKEIINGVRYWETDGQTSIKHVKGRLKKNVKFWREELMAPENIIRVIEDGYILPLLLVPNAYKADNQRSARENNEFVTKEVSKLVNNGCVRAFVAQPFVCRPLSVVINAKGKKRLVVNLRYLNQFLWKQKFKYDDMRIALLMLYNREIMFTFDLKSGYHHINIYEPHQKHLGFE